MTAGQEDRRTGRQEDRKTGRQEDRRTGRQEDRRTAEEEVASRRRRRKPRIMIRTGLCLLLCLTSLHGEKVGPC